LSILATSLAFLSSDGRLSVGLFAAPITLFIGLLTVIIFGLVLVDVTLDWRKRAWAHADAAHRLGGLKAVFRSATIGDDGVETASLDLRTEYEVVMQAIHEIPERQFLSLKVKHHRKVELSKLIDTHKGAPLPYLRLLAAWNGACGVNRSSREDDAQVAESVEQPPA
jgi:hypothetical protein